MRRCRQPLLISLAETREPRRIVNRAGNQASEDGAALGMRCRCRLSAGVRLPKNRVSRRHGLQLKNGPRSLTAPVDNLYSNGAYMLMTSLAWSLKAWLALSVPEHRSLQDSPSGREDSSVENGIPHLRDSHDSHPLPDRADGWPHDLPSAERQPSAAGVLATGGFAATLEVDRSPSRTAASSLVQRSQDLDILILCRHRSAPKEVYFAINEIRANQRRTSFVSGKSLRQFSAQTTPARSLVLRLGSGFEGS